MSRPPRLHRQPAAHCVRSPSGSPRDGFAVELPRLPGHGTAIEDMIPTRWSDWSDAAESAYAELAARCPPDRRRRTLDGRHAGCLAAIRHPEIVALVVINPLDRSAAPRSSGTLCAARWRPGPSGDRQSVPTSPSPKARSCPTPACRWPPLITDGRRPRRARPACLDRLPGDVLQRPRTTWCRRRPARAGADVSGSGRAGDAWSGATTWPPWTTTAPRSRRGPVEFLAKTSRPSPDGRVPARVSRAGPGLAERDPVMARAGGRGRTSEAAAASTPTSRRWSGRSSTSSWPVPPRPPFTVDWSHRWRATSPRARPGPRSNEAARRRPVRQ